MKIQATFYPGVPKEHLENGTISEIGWQRLHPFLCDAFAIREGEELIGITVTDAGIKAKIRHTFTPSNK